MSDLELLRAVGNSEQLVDQVTKQIEDLIVNGQFEPETIMPSQTELAVQLKVSRTVIREAIRILSAKGLVESKRGVGTRVQRVTRQQVVEPLELLLRTSRGGLCFEDLHIVRTILEVEIAAIAASKASETDIEKLKGIMSGMESAIDEPTIFAERDATFHLALAEATHNPLLAILSDSVRQLLEEYLLLVTPHLDLREQALPYHYRILEHVASHNIQEARLAMEAHLGSTLKIQQDLFGVSDCADSTSS